MYLFRNMHFGDNQRNFKGCLAAVKSLRLWDERKFIVLITTAMAGHRIQKSISWCRTWYLDITTWYHDILTPWYCDTIISFKISWHLNFGQDIMTLVIITRGKIIYLDLNYVWFAVVFFLSELRNRHATTVFFFPKFWIIRIYCDHMTGCKENHFYSLPFGQAEASIY